MHRLEITQTDLAAVADPNEVVLHDEVDFEDDLVLHDEVDFEDDLADASLPLPPRVMQVEEVGAAGERIPAPAVVEGNARLALELPVGTARLVLLALDADGQVIASRDLGIETAIAAEVFLYLLAAGLESEALEAVDLHVRLTADVAAALAAAAHKAKEARRRPRPLPSVPFATTPRGR